MLNWNGGSSHSQGTANAIGDAGRTEPWIFRQMAAIQRLGR